jgi:hypothetical protein
MENDGMFGMGGWGILIILFFLMSGGFGGWGNNGGVATSNEVQRGFDNQNSMANQREILGATNQVYHDLATVIGDKYSELTRDVYGVSGQVAQVLANQNECCCNTLRAIDSVKYDNLQNTNKILEAMAQSKIDALQSKVQALELAQATSSVVRYPTSTTYNAGFNPFCNGCGCGV